MCKNCFSKLHQFSTIRSSHGTIEWRLYLTTSETRDEPRCVSDNPSHQCIVCRWSIRPQVQADWLKVTFCGVEDFEGIHKALLPKTKALYCESMAIPSGLVVDPERLADIDNTTATSYLVRPFEYGADVIVHSATEVLDGHGRSLNFNGLMEALCPQPNGCRSGAGAVRADRLPCRRGERQHDSRG